MWNADKLDKTAKALLPQMNARVYVQLQNAIDNYGIDKGENILVLFGCYFTPDFLRQFHTGNMREFWSAWEDLQVKVKIQQDRNQWHIKQS